MQINSVILIKRGGRQTIFNIANMSSTKTTTWFEVCSSLQEHVASKQLENPTMKKKNALGTINNKEQQNTFWRLLA